MLAKAIVFNAFVIVYLNAFLVAVRDEGLPASGVLVSAGFVKLYAISKREQEIIQLICEGKSNDEIGRQLFISLPTVKGHVYNVFQKTGVKNRVQLVNLIKVSTLPEAKGDRNCPESRMQPR
jgi:DNA-binding CsgD family transcriptional regulator